jgi:group I intron endonuclease
MDRKALRNKFKESIQPMGIYQIRNILNGKIFVGSSINLQGIINRHTFQLQAGLHMNKPLQRDFLEFGQANFAFEILDTLQPKEAGKGDCAEELRTLEELWRERLRPEIEKGYHHG